MEKNRDISIDIIKFFAVFLIINSHADKCYTHFSILATGGAIGDCLFLFCSGFTIFLGKTMRFDNYYKRRINRIYPSVIASVMVMLLANWQEFSDLTFDKVMGGEFIIAIMVYYILLYLVRGYAFNRIAYVFVFTAIVTLAAYYFFPYKYETGENGIYGIKTLFRWIPYFGFMLLGAYIGIKKDSLKFSPRWDFIKMMICLLLFYGIQFASKKIPEIASFQIVTLLFLIGIVFYFYKCCNALFFQRIYRKGWGNYIIMGIGNLCLESYLIQHFVITSKLNSLFPLNIPIVIIMVLIVSYIVKCLARLFSQTFNSEDYEWKKIFAL